MRTGLDAKRKVFALQNLPCQHQGILTAALHPAVLPDTHWLLTCSISPFPGLGAWQRGSACTLAAPVCLSASSWGALRAPQEDKRQLCPHGFQSRVQAEVGWHHYAQDMASPAARCCGFQIFLLLPKSHLLVPSCSHHPSSHASGTSGWDAGMK